ncbi:hypothetical protein Gotur_002270 [Gossypium turneri]
MLYKRAEPITANSTDLRWKWFKNCLGALDGTHIKIRVPKGYQPSTLEEFFNMKHASAHNVIERCSRLLKLR